MERTLKLIYLHNADISSRMANLVQVVSMCSAFASLRIETILVLRSSGTDQQEAKRLLTARFGCHPDVRLVLIHDRLPSKISRHLSHFSIRKILKREQPDFCFVRDPQYFRIAIKQRVPTVLELHNTRLHLGFQWLNRWYTHMVLKGASKASCTGVVLISDALRSFWQNHGIPASKAQVLHDGFSPELFNARMLAEDARKAADLPLDRKIVVYTGNLQANRGIDYILDLAALHSGILFVLVGGSPDRIAHYTEQCQQRGIQNIQLQGHQPHTEIPKWLYAADVLLAMWSKDVPTINYCSPLKVFEYMATGIPAIYPGYPTISEVISDGFNGFLSAPDSVAAFSETLTRVLDLSDSGKVEFGLRAREKAMQNYTWEHRAERIAFMMKFKTN
jgi:glycosyltransferase involved in cell wall biosynthesis